MKTMETVEFPQRQIEYQQTIALEVQWQQFIETAE
jgi:hypothetical protein